MAENLMKAGYDLLVYNHKIKTQELVEKGATWKDTIAELPVKPMLLLRW